MKRKLTALLLAALMVCGSLAGCGSKITPEAEGSEGGDAPAAASAWLRTRSQLSTPMV